MSVESMLEKGSTRDLEARQQGPVYLPMLVAVSVSLDKHAAPQACRGSLLDAYEAIGSQLSVQYLRYSPLARWCFT